MDLSDWPEFDEGYRAYNMGFSNHNNPHDDYMKRMAWFQGHEEAWVDDK